eukprot:TRINITY_DN6435_c0_g1_i1.p1 TRINITY_DN6435_c0_g1~~TRINITY_DN6435_c0_g1_i1.p1  ORF type:complete len:958 (+),score=228.72 TRINITY_DN6435_c0_g1_i1:62-2935(+)
MEIIDNSLYEIGEQLTNLIQYPTQNQKLSIIQLIDKLCNKINLMQYHLKIRIKLEAIKNRMQELKTHLNNMQNQGMIQMPQITSIFLEFGKVLSPRLILFDCFSPILENVLNRKNKTIVGSNTLIWTKNLFYLAYFFTNNNEEFHKLSELLIDCINEIKNEYDEDVISPSTENQNNDYKAVQIYHFLEECATRIFQEQKIDFYCGKETKHSCFIPQDLLLKKIHNKALKKDHISVRFSQIFRGWIINSICVKELPNLFSERNFNQPNPTFAPKRTIPLSDIVVNISDNQFIQLELSGDFSEVEGKSCEIHLINERIIFFKIYVQSIKDKKKIDIKVPRSIYEASYLIAIESPHFSSNPIQYDHHQNFPNSQKIKLNPCYIDCCYPIFKKTIINYSPKLFSQKDFKQRSPLMVACLNQSWENVSIILKNKNNLEINLNDIDEDGNTCLHFAAYFGSFAIVKELINLGSNPNVLNRYGETPLFFSQKHFEIFNYLALLTSNSPIVPSIFFWELRDDNFLYKWNSEKKNINENINEIVYNMSYMGDLGDTGSMDPSMGNDYSGSMMDNDSDEKTPNHYNNRSGNPQSGNNSDGNWSPNSNIETFFDHNVTHKNPISTRSTPGSNSFHPSYNSQTQIPNSLTNSYGSSNSTNNYRPKSVVNNNNNDSGGSDSKDSGSPQSTDCFEIYNNISNGSFKVNWLPSPVSAYLRWAKPVPVVKYQLAVHQNCCVEVMLMDSSSNEVCIPKKKNFFSQHKKTHSSSCIFPLNPKENTIKLKFGFNVTTNMYYQKITNESESGSEDISSKKRKLQSTQGRFKLHFVLWETKNYKNKYDWVKLGVWSSSLFNLVSHSDQINQNKNSTSPNPECIYPNPIPENTNFPITIVGSFPSNLPNYTVVFREEDGTTKHVQLNQQNSKMIVGNTPLLKAGNVIVYVVEKESVFPQNGLSFQVIGYNEWKKIHFPI